MKITLVVRLYILSLAVYTGVRTFDFIFNQLPKGLNESAAFGMAVIFLFSTEAGMFLWHTISNGHCTTETQSTISIAMTWIDFIASLSAGIADMILWQTLTSYEIDPVFAQFLIFGMPISLGANILAGLVFLSNDGDTILKTEEQKVAFEGTKLAIENVRRNKKSWAAQIAPEIEKKIQSRVMGDSAIKVETIEELAKKIDKEFVSPPVVSQNGKKPVISQNGNDESARNFHPR